MCMSFSFDCYIIYASGSTVCSICDDCMSALQKCNVPRCSLVRLDGGLRPPDLERLTPFESLVLSPYRILQHLVLLTDADQHSPAVPVLQCHIVSTKAPTPGAVARLFPCRLEEIPERFSCILLRTCSCAEMVQLVKKVKAIQVILFLLLLIYENVDPFD